MPETLLAVQQVSKHFAGVRALDQVDLTVNRGEIHCLVGENGSGKSTVIKTIAGVHSPDAGAIIIGGKAYTHWRPIDAIREGIQVIYQDFSLFPNLTVAENIALNSQLAQNRRLVNWREVRRTAQAALEQIGHNIDLDARVEGLSVADKQLVAICRALVQNAKLIIMDEATTALTEQEVQSLFKIIKHLQAQGIAILFVSHKLNEVFGISEQITIIRNGKNVAHGDAASFDRTTLVQHMTGRELDDQPFVYQHPPAGGPSLLKVENLARRGTFAGISFELQPGEILGITGLLGSGRTELALALFGMRPADSGQVYLDGKPLHLRSVQDAVDNGIAYVPEDRLTEGLFLSQPIAKNMAVGTIRRLLTGWGLTDRTRMDTQVAEWVKHLRIATPSAQLPVNSLSGGNQQRVVLARWLATNPRVLILNGPTVGVDVGSKSDIHHILRDLAQRGVGVIIISDDLPEVLQNCNRILVMRKGRLIDEFGADQVTENELAHKLSGGVTL